MSILEDRVDVKDIKVERIEEDRKDPTTFLPDEPMTYEIKTKKKKKKKKQEDPFKDIEEKIPLTTVTIYDPITEVNTETVLDPEVNIKVENIEVELDFNDFANDNGLMVEGPQSEDSQEPAVKIEDQSHEAVLLTFESIIHDKNVLGFSPASAPATNYVCKICHLVFQSPKTLRMHQKRKHKVFRKSFKHICDYCGMSYEQKNSLVAHIKRKHGPNSVPDDGEERTCDVCALVFKGMTRLRMHMRRKHGSFEESFKHVCQECGLTYDKYRSLIVHIQRKHNNDKKPVLDTWYNCPFCPKVFTKRETYARHVQRKHRISDDDEMKHENHDLENYKNEATGEVTCKECPLVFSSVTFLKLHMRRKHNALKEDFRLKCKICNLSYDKIESLKRHIRRKHDKNSYCDVCDKQFESREVYLTHTHKRIVQECSVCNLIFATHRGLCKHLRTTHKVELPRTVFCDLCNESFHDKRQLKPHYMKVHLKASYTCIFCKKIFKAKESYRRHVLLKHPVNEKTCLQKCDQCTESFADEFELCKHINMAHRQQNSEIGPLTLIDIKKEEVDIPETFHCTKCSNTYNNWNDLKTHYEQSHISVAETQCQICGELVPGNELQKHIKTAHTDTSVRCKYCEFVTNNRASMTQHMLRHKNATTIHCDYSNCKYKTFYEGAMEKHKRRHRDQGVKLQCSQCPFQTMGKYILKYHEEAHSTGKKRYSCDQCDYATILPANLVQHRYKHSSEKRFKCEVCPFATKYNTSLRFHVKKKHCDLPTFS
ncbi:zinc finger and BTB domain-containing protein 41-like [Danaus plexippus]|uniref:zinc finger and BTB domain-containing protein 41-like n=1 Tax=Danaus plexippus TaxID=13037 RepID=UPI002AB31714|nr:zinc finger and BTB domain-containing protein 41-like [Danaus plexippus]